MNVTVADCLKLPTLREAQLIAGAKGLKRAVSSVSVLEWPEIHLLSDEVIIGNELIISALVPVKDNVERQCSLLRHLRSMGSACLVLFYVGIFIPRIDEALIAVADEISFPLIVMPCGRMDFRYSDVITDVVEYIHTRRMEGNYYMAEVMNSIALLEPQKRNINTVLRLLADRMRCTLLLSDRYLERKGAAAWPVSNQWDYQMLLQRLQRCKDQLKRQTEMEIEGRPLTLWDVPVPSKTHRGMHLFALDEFNQLKEEALQQAVDVVALFLNIWDKGTYYDGTDALVDAILTDDPAKMRKLALQMGISIDAVHTMWVLQTAEPESGQELTESQKLDIILKLKIYLQDYHKIVIVDSHDPHIVALTDGLVLEENVRNLSEAFVESLQKEDYDVRCCIFEELNNTSETRDAYNRMVNCFTELCLTYPQRRVYTDSDVRFVRSCMDCVRQGEDFVAGCLLPIHKLQDVTDGDVLIETLCTYLLDAEANTQRTGTLLYLHKNTVHYRLNKIRNVLKCDLVQMPAALAVYQAAAIYRILKGF
ncbi:MAG: PucR family transcriptional regulator [Clostridiales bacterium]|nr:PucR family transcriptional regulator [Clostridiales bacterium]